MILVWRRKHRRVGRWSICTIYGRCAHFCQKHCWSYSPFGNITACQIESIASKLSFLMADQEDSNNHLPCRYLSQSCHGDFDNCRVFSLAWMLNVLVLSKTSLLTQLSMKMKGDFLSNLQYHRRSLCGSSLERLSCKVFKTQM